MRKILIYVAALLTLVASCARESVPDVPDQPEDCSSSFAIVLDNGVVTTAPSIRTKGIIATSGTVSAYESRMTEVHVGVYLGGTLVSDYIPGTSPALALDRTKAYDFYAVTAVGDSWTWPSNEGDLSSKAIDILPDLSSYSSKGIPCFGRVLGMRPEAADAADGSADGNIRIEVRRLFAKVELDIVTPSGELNPYSISPSDVRVRRINSVLRPFAGGCAAADPSDVRDASSGNGTDHTVSGETSGTMVFYVPENLQGSPLTGNTDSYLKTPGSIDDAVGGVKSQLCTYIEVNCSAEAVSAFVSEYGAGQVSGSLAYRFLLGDDNLSDCNVEGGRVYRVTLTLRKKGLDLVGNWKVDNTDMDDRRSFAWGVHWGKVRPGGTAYLTASYGTVSTVKSDFHAPGWGAAWGFDGGSKAQYDAYVASGSAVGLTHAHGVNVTCPECGYIYIAFPDGGNGDLLRLGQNGVRDIQRQWVSDNFVVEDGAHLVCRYCTDTPYRFFPGQSSPSALPYVDVGSKSWAGGGADDFLWVPVPSATPSGSVYPVYGGSGDGRVTDSIDIQVGDDTPVLLDLSTLPRYVAQQGTVTVTRLPSGVSGVTFRIDGQSVPGMLDVSDASPSSANVSCTVKAMRAGSATVKVYDKANGEELGSFALSVAAPLVRRNAGISNVVALPLDGTSKTVACHYETTDRQVMTVAASDADGNGRKFAPTLYASYLGDPVVGPKDGSVVSSHLGADAGGLYINNLTGIRAKIGNTYSGAVRAYSGKCPDVEELLFGVLIQHPVLSGRGDLGTVNDWSLTKEYFSSRYWDTSRNISGDASARALTPEGTLDYNRSTTYSVQTAPSLLKFYSFRSDTDLDAISDATAESLRFSNINVIVNSGTTTIRLSDTDKKAAGPISVCARVVNNRSSQVIFVEAWTLRVYINTVYGGLFVFDNPSSNVRTDMGDGEGRLEVAGYSSIPGNVREEVKNAVTFLSGSNYNSTFDSNILAVTDDDYEISFSGETCNVTLYNYKLHKQDEYSLNYGLFSATFYLNHDGSLEDMEHWGGHSATYPDNFASIVLDRDFFFSTFNTTKIKASGKTLIYSPDGVKDSSGNGYFVLNNISDCDRTSTRGWIRTILFN